MRPRSQSNRVSRLRINQGQLSRLGYAVETLPPSIPDGSPLRHMTASSIIHGQLHMDKPLQKTWRSYTIFTSRDVRRVSLCQLDADILKMTASKIDGIKDRTSMSEVQCLTEDYAKLKGFVLTRLREHLKHSGLTQLNRLLSIKGILSTQLIFVSYYTLPLSSPSDWLASQDIWHTTNLINDPSLEDFAVFCIPKNSIAAVKHSDKLRTGVTIGEGQGILCVSQLFGKFIIDSSHLKRWKPIYSNYATSGCVMLVMKINRNSLRLHCSVATRSQLIIKINYEAVGDDVDIRRGRRGPRNRGKKERERDIVKAESKWQAGHFDKDENLNNMFLQSCHCCRWALMRQCNPTTKYFQTQAARIADEQSRCVSEILLEQSVVCEKPSDANDSSSPDITFPLSFDTSSMLAASSNYRLAFPIPGYRIVKCISPLQTFYSFTEEGVQCVVKGKGSQDNRGYFFLTAFAHPQTLTWNPHFHESYGNVEEAHQELTPPEEEERGSSLTADGSQVNVSELPRPVMHSSLEGGLTERVSVMRDYVNEDTSEDYINRETEARVEEIQQESHQHMVAASSEVSRQNRGERHELGIDEEVVRSNQEITVEPRAEGVENNTETAMPESQILTSDTSDKQSRISPYIKEEDELQLPVGKSSTNKRRAIGRGRRASFWDASEMEAKKTILVDNWKSSCMFTRSMAATVRTKKQNNSDSHPDATNCHSKADEALQTNPYSRRVRNTKVNSRSAACSSGTPCNNEFDATPSISRYSETPKRPRLYRKSEPDIFGEDTQELSCLQNDTMTPEASSTSKMLMVSTPSNSNITQFCYYSQTPSPISLPSSTQSVNSRTASSYVKKPTLYRKAKFNSCSTSSSVDEDIANPPSITTPPKTDATSTIYSSGGHTTEPRNSVSSNPIICDMSPVEYSSHISIDGYNNPDEDSSSSFACVGPTFLTRICHRYNALPVAPMPSLYANTSDMKSKTSPSSISSLQLPLLCHILAFLGIREVYRFRQVCKTFCHETLITKSLGHITLEPADFELQTLCTLYPLLSKASVIDLSSITEPGLIIPVAIQYVAAACESAKLIKFSVPSYQQAAEGVLKALGHRTRAILVQEECASHTEIKKELKEKHRTDKINICVSTYPAVRIGNASSTPKSFQMCKSTPFRRLMRYYKNEMRGEHREIDFLYVKGLVCTRLHPDLTPLDYSMNGGKCHIFAALTQSLSFERNLFTTLYLQGSPEFPMLQKIRINTRMDTTFSRLAECYSKCTGIPANEIRLQYRKENQVIYLDKNKKPTDYFIEASSIIEATQLAGYGFHPSITSSTYFHEAD